VHVKKPIRLYIFDADGTLRRSTVPGQPCPNMPGNWEPRGAHFGIATNQGGIKLGFITYEMARRLLVEMVREAFGIAPPAGSIEICPHAPRANCPCRKPKPEMLLRLMRRFGAEPDETLFVGDMDNDEEAARLAGIRFTWAHEFFGRRTQEARDI
jgi:D-glycero-D-manno-heptose 1,7-bisphosphate phosphatase